MGVNNPGQTDDGDDRKKGDNSQEKPGQKPGEGDRQRPGENKPGQGFPQPGSPNRNPDPNRYPR